MMKTLDKELIKQIILDFDKFRREDIWLCRFEDVVEEFAENRASEYLVDMEGE